MSPTIRICLAVALVAALCVNASGQGEEERLIARAADALRAGHTETAARLAGEALDPPGAPAPKALWIRGNAFEGLERYSEAVLDFGRLAELDRLRPGVHLALGRARFKAGDFSGSVAAFDAATNLDRTLGPHLWQRGIAQYYAGRPGDCAKQFTNHRTVNPQDVENSVWHFLCVAERDGIEEARRRLMPVERDSRVPMSEVLALFRGSGSEAAVIKAAERATSAGSGDSPLFYAHLYVGLFKDASGDRSAADEHLRMAVGMRNPGNYMWQIARIHRAQRTAEKRVSKPVGAVH